MGTGLGSRHAQPHSVHGAQEHSPVHYPMDESCGQGPLCSLDNNISHFILVDPGAPRKGDGPTELWLRLEKHISEQRTSYGGEDAQGGRWGHGGRKDHQVGGEGHSRQKAPRGTWGPGRGSCGRGGGHEAGRVVLPGVAAAPGPLGLPWPEALAGASGLWEESSSAHFPGPEVCCHQGAVPPKEWEPLWGLRTGFTKKHCCATNIYKQGAELLMMFTNNRKCLSMELSLNMKTQ